MRGDEAQPENESSAPRARTGPRHAAPRKSLLTRAPVGKAIALAAMPTAVLMGMGLTPRLAQADELPKNPFSGDHCVTQSDSPSPSSSPSPSATPSATPSPSASASATPKAAPSRSIQPTASPTTGATAQQAKPGSATQPAVSPSPTSGSTHNPLDPLGLGATLKGLLGGGSSASTTPSASSTPTPSSTPSATPTPSSSPAASDPASTVDKTVQGATGAAKSTVDNTAKAAASAAPSASPSGSPSSAPSPTQGQPFPCPTYNAQALADAGLERTPSLLPDQPWVLKTDLLTLYGLDYKGVVKVKTENGTVKDVLKFTSTGVDIKNLHQITEGPAGAHFNVQARDGSTSTIRNGTVTMYTEKISGNLFGIIPVTFSPQSPPPVNVPLAIFSNCTVIQAGQFGGTLTIPGMHVYRS